MRSTRGSGFSRPSSSAARSVKLRERLRRSGAMVSSRSALSRQDATSEDFLVVDVGPGETPTAVEQLIARFEQHGLRRCLLSESADVLEYGVAPGVVLERDYVPPTGGAPAQEASSHGAQAHTDGAFGTTSLRESSRGSRRSRTGLRGDGKREPYYYLCVPCETRLTNISTTPATHEMLEDMHYHFSSAQHREAASWMVDPDIDETLSTSPLVEDPHAYTRIYVNGIPMLLSRRPGGGDLFYPLPHEVERVSVRKVVRRASVVDTLGRQEKNSSRPEDGLLFPSPRYSSDANYWYRPLSSLDPRSKQVVSHVPRGIYIGDTKAVGEILTQHVVRNALRVDYVPVDTYLQQTLLHKDRVPIHPRIFALETHKLPKSVVAATSTRKRDRDDDVVVMGRRCFYVQPKDPYVETTPANRSRDEVWRDRCLVEANGVYRVVVLSNNELREAEVRKASGTATAESNMAHNQGAGSQPVLTRELLSQVSTHMPYQQYHSVGTSVGSHGHLSKSDRDFSSQTPYDSEEEEEDDVSESEGSRSSGGE